MSAYDEEIRTTRQARSTRARSEPYLFVEYGAYLEAQRKLREAQEEYDRAKRAWRAICQPGKV